MDNKELIRRLSYVKYIYQIAIEQSYKPEPLNSISLLTFHDAVELFNQVVVESKNISIKGKDFDEYRKVFESNNIKITMTESMSRMNKARVALKHHGNLPSNTDIESFRVNVTSYLIENALALFVLNFNDISLIDSIKNDKVKKLLQESLNILNDGNYEESAKLSSDAFQELIKSVKYPSITSFSGVGLRRTSGINISADQVDKNFQIVSEKLSELTMILKIISVGINFNEYLKFVSKIPISITTCKLTVSSRNKYDKEGCIFCINFVIESALKIQEI